MIRATRIVLLAPLAVLLCGCEPPPAPLASSPPPARDRLITPWRIVPGHLEYTQEPDAFAPILTHRAAYPTQDQAQNAYHREDMAAVYSTKGPYVIRASDPLPFERRAARIRLFACRPGALDSITGRIEPASENGVHCATDFLDEQGRRLSRETVNFYYYADAWHMRETDAPTTKAPWINPERSPRDYFSWLPFGKRSTPYN